MTNTKPKRLRTNRKRIGGELQKLKTLSAERRSSLSCSAMCLWAAFALGWVLGEFDAPTAQIVQSLEKKRSRDEESNE